ncbi:MAG: cytochrome c [candidate division NC10 bacterium]|nr:cytochrome c [candidate division NC10 bacterium]
MSLKRLKRLSLILFGGLLSLFFVFPAWAAEPGFRLPENPVEGRRLFVSKGCARCHTVWGEGGTGGPDLGKISPAGSFLQLAGILWNHSPQMTERMGEKGIQRPTFTPEEMAKLVAYLYSLQYFGEAGDPARGKALFAEKSCIKCHSVGGKGGEIGPPLDKFGRFLSPIAMAQAMWNHGPEMATAMQALKIPRPKFEGKEIADLLAYIRVEGKGGEGIYMLPGSPTEGRRLFQDKDCIKCHAVRGKGGTIGPDLGRRELKRTVSEVAGIMWNHAPHMWAKMKTLRISEPKFSGKEMADLIAYLYFTGYLDEPGDHLKGKRIFSEKGCMACHSLGGKGGKVGPDLSRSKAVTSPIDLASALWNHAPAMEKVIEEQRLPWPRFEGENMRDLVAYLQSFTKATVPKR